MWSPPRARSTMMMRVFEAIGCQVMDEPFYAYWLKATDKSDDPGFAVTLREHETDWRKIIDLLFAPLHDEDSWQYQKHMAIHMLDEVDLSWMQNIINAFLIRHPAEVIVSMSEFRALAPTTDRELHEAAALVGIPQLKRIFDLAHEISGQSPPVIDANDVLASPDQVLGAFCDEVGLPFNRAHPISWAPGRHPNDGAWADDWYQKVYETTELGTYIPRETVVPEALKPVVDYCLPTYEYIASFKLGTNSDN